MAEKSIDQYYKTLGVNPGASRWEIESAYKYKKKIWRVDESTDNKMKTMLSSELQEIEEAYQKILSHQANTSTAGKSSSRFKDRAEYETWKASKITESQGRQSSLNDKSTYYQILGLKSSASKEEIKQAYKDLLNVWTPDRFSNEPSLHQKAQQKIKEIDEAYEKLLLHLASARSTASQVSSGFKTSRTIHDNTTNRVEPVYKPIESNKQTSDDNRTKQAIKFFSWKSFIAAVIIASVLNGILSVAAGVNPALNNISWTVMWLYLSIESWRYWKWKALLPYPLFWLASGISGLIMEGSVEQLSMPYLIVKGTLNIGGLILFYILLHRSRVPHG